MTHGFKQKKIKQQEMTKLEVHSWPCYLAQ